MNDKSKVYISVKDFLVTGESFDLLYDQTKEMLFTSPQPSEENLYKYYDSEEYLSHTDSKIGIMASVYQRVKKYSIRKKARLITKLNSGSGKLLDVGAGTGDFLLASKRAGWEVKGVEVNEKAKALAREKGIKIENNIEAYAGNQFDVITLWHVLEHLPNLEQSIKNIESLVKPGGILIVAVPNFKSYDAKYYKNYWAAYDAPRHLWHFSSNSIPILFSESMRLQKIKPMIFDSFYVSLLSEKYKSGKSFSIMGIIIGFWSNLLAWRNKNYSSLIYCLKKS